MLGFANQIVQGILLGGLYALFALGLSLSVGIIRLVNLAHGDFIVLISFVLLAVTTSFGVSPLLAVVLVVPLAFAAGYAVQRGLLQHVVGRGVLPPLLVTFGLSIVIQNVLLQIFGADTRKISAGAIETATLPIAGGINVGVLSLLTLGTAVGAVIVLERLLYGSSFGARIRAVSDDAASANLIGLPTMRIYALAMGIVAVTATVAAGFMSVSGNFEPTSGPSRLLIAFEAVVLGGLGSLWGTLAGGIILGVAQSVGAQFDVGWEQLAGHIAFLLIFLIKPRGLFPRG